MQTYTISIDKLLPMQIFTMSVSHIYRSGSQSLHVNCPEFL